MHQAGVQTQETAASGARLSGRKCQADGRGTEDWRPSNPYYGGQPQTTRALNQAREAMSGTATGRGWGAARRSSAGWQSEGNTRSPSRRRTGGRQAGAGEPESALTRADRGGARVVTPETRSRGWGVRRSRSGQPASTQDWRPHGPPYPPLWTSCARVWTAHAPCSGQPPFGRILCSVLRCSTWNAVCAAESLDGAVNSGSVRMYPHPAYRRCDARIFPAARDRTHPRAELRSPVRLRPRLWIASRLPGVGTQVQGPALGSGGAWARRPAPAVRSERALAGHHWRRGMPFAAPG